MADEIYINIGQSFQQPYQGQSVVNAQSPETKQAVGRTPANARQPSTYQHRSPFTYRNPTNKQSPYIANARQPFIYTARSPFTYSNQVPFTYSNQGASPYIANSQTPFTYQHPASAQYPYIANARQPSTYRNPTNKQSPYIANAQQPYPYIANAQQPVIARAPYPFITQQPVIAQATYNYRHTARVPANARQPVSYIYDPLEQSWGPGGGNAYWDTTQSDLRSQGGPLAFCQMSFYLDTNNNQIDVDWSGGTSQAAATLYTDSIDYLSPIVDGSTFSVKYDVSSQYCTGDCNSTYCYSGNLGPLPTNQGYNSGTYYGLNSVYGRQFWWGACYSPNLNSNGTTSVQANGVSFTVRAVQSGTTYTTTYSHGGISLYATFGNNVQIR